MHSVSLQEQFVHMPLRTVRRTTLLSFFFICGTFCLHQVVFELWTLDNRYFNYFLRLKTNQVLIRTIDMVTKNTDRFIRNDELCHDDDTWRDYYSNIKFGNHINFLIDP